MLNLQPNFKSSDHDWYVREAGDEIVTLQCRDTNEIATMHVDDLQNMQ